jgi:hypothetical protein
MFPWRERHWKVCRMMAKEFMRGLLI